MVVKPTSIPASPGVYLFRDSEGRVIYAGKALSLKHRLSNYFSESLESRTAAMVQAADSVEWIITANEVAALQLEFTMIQTHRPRFNSRYRDDKSYPFLTLTTSEDIPRAMVVRGKKKKGDRYFGPFANAYAVRETLDLLLRVFPMRSCSKGVFDRARRANRPCLLYDIGKCAGPCAYKVTPAEHLNIVDGLISFMEGNQVQVVRDLRQAMEKAAADLEFENAAHVRDQINAAERVLARQEMIGHATENLDAIALVADDLQAAIQIFYVRAGRVVGRNGFIVDRIEPLDESELLEDFLMRHYGEETPPAQVCVTRLPSSQEVCEQYLKLRRGGSVRIGVPARGQKLALLKTAGQNARDSLEQSKLKRASDFGARSRALNELQEALSLPHAPLRIECFDISNLGPAEIVGSMVVFEDGLAKKSDYRKFKITSGHQDDVGAMGELLERRFARMLESSPRSKDDRFAYRPGLIVVDGGKGQLNRAVEAMMSSGVVEVPIVALAKRLEEVYVPGEIEARVIPRGSEALYMLQRVRDEAHRFALTFQVKRRKSAIVSVLDKVPGLGSAKRAALLRKFGSVAAVRRASADDLQSAEGIGPKLAAQIVDFFSK